MKKNHGKLLAYALAGALSVGNLSGVVAMPFTTIVAQAANLQTEYPTASEITWTIPNKIYAGDAYGVKAEFAELTSSLKMRAVVKNSTISGINEGYVFMGTASGSSISLATVDEGNGIQEAAVGTMTIRLQKLVDSVWTDISGTDKVITVTDKLSETTMSEISGTVHNIPTYAFSSSYQDLTKKDLVLKVTETHPVGHRTDIEWRVYKNDIAIQTKEGEITDAQVTAESTDTKYVEQATIAAVQNGLAAGEYTIKAFPQGEVDKAVGSYTFNVVGGPTAPYSITDKFGAALDNPSVEVGKDIELGVWNTAGPAENITWSVTEATKNIATVSDKGVVTGRAKGNAVVGAVWNINNDMKLAITPTLTVGVEDAVLDYALTYDDSHLSLNTLGTAYELDAEVGDSGQLSYTYGDDPVSTKWSTKSDGVVTVTEAGEVTAVAAGDAVITGTYTKDGASKTVKINVTVTEKTPLTGAYFIGHSTTDADTANLYPGDQLQLYYKYNDGSPIDGAVTWTSNNKLISVKDGLITVSSEAEAPLQATIMAAVDGVSGGVFTVNVEAATYQITSVKVNGKEITPNNNKYELFVGQTAEMTVKYAGKEVTTGTFKIAEPNSNFVLTGNKIKANRNDIVGDATVSYYPAGSSNPVAGATFTVKEDAYTVSSTPTADWNITNQTEGEATIAELEVGETVSITATYGSTDLTNSMTWKSDSDAAKVDKGNVTAIKSSGAFDITGSYEVDNKKYTVTLTITKIVPSTGAVEASETATENAEIASDKAGSAIDNADKAIEASKAAKDNPTADNLKAAESALNSAKDELAAAKAALKEAQDALDNADPGHSQSAKDAVTAAQNAVGNAADKVAEAEVAVSDAQEAFDELAPEVEKMKAKEAAISAAETAAATAATTPTQENIDKANAAVAAAKEKGATEAELKAATDNIAKAVAAKKAADDKAAEEKKAADEKKAEEEKKAAEEKAAADKKAADQAIGATGTDAATGTNYTVADTAAKTVAFTGTTSTAKSFVIPDAVTIDGDTFQVTSIAANAFKGSSATTVTIGKNISKIDKSAFSNSNVKKVKVKGTKLTKAMAKAFNKLKKGSKIKVTGANKKANKKLLKNLKNVKNGKIKVE